MTRVDHALLTPEVVVSAVNRIVAACQPRMILVFGSRARGDARPDSDLDLLVVLAAAAPDLVGLRWHLQWILKDLPIAKDVLVSEPDHFAFWSHHHNSVYRTAAEEGFTLWESGRLDQAAVARVCR